MAKQFIRELDDLKKKIFTLCTMVEENLQNAVRSILENNEQLAQSVVGYDDSIDRMEIEVEEECLKILALYQPVAVDLRFIIGALKINSDLERVGDMAVNIAERGFQLFKLDSLPVHVDFSDMLIKALAMLKKSLDAFVTFDEKLSYEVCAMDDEVDNYFRGMFDIFKEEVIKNPQAVHIMLHYLSIARQLERIGDHATNIAEDVIYMVTGDIIRHGKYLDGDDAAQKKE